MELELTVNELLAAKQEVSTILQQPIEYAAKFAFLDLEDILTEATSNFEVIRTEIITKYGILDEASGNYVIKAFESEDSKVISENYKKFQEEITSVLNQVKSVSFTPVPLDFLKGIASATSGRDLRKFIQR